VHRFGIVRLCGAAGGRSGGGNCGLLGAERHPAKRQNQEQTPTLRNSFHYSLHPIANFCAAVRNCTGGPRRNAASSMRNYTRVALGASFEKFIPSIDFSDATVQIASILMNSLCPCSSLH